MTTARITANWDNPEKTVIRADFHPFWSWDDYHATNLIIAKMLSEDPSDKPVPIINIYHPGTNIPMENAVQHIAFMVDVLPTNIIILICDDNFREDIYSFARLFGYRKDETFFNAEDVEHGRQIADMLLQKA